jgi:hypothetical protein
MQSKRLERILGIIQLVFAALGLVSLLIIVFKDNLTNASLLLFLFTPIIFTLVSSILFITLNKIGLILFIASSIIQIPIIYITNFKYEYFTGLQFGIGFIKKGLQLLVNAGLNVQFGINSKCDEYLIGINFIPIIMLLILWIINHKPNKIALTSALS